MESDEGHKQRKNGNFISILGDFFQSLGIRCNLEGVNRYDRKLLAFNFCFLPCISVLFYAIFLIR